MSIEIVVLNRFDAEQFDCPAPWACISIATTEDDFAEIPDENRIALLQLAFADITHPLGGYAVFSVDQAYDILDFITQHWDSIRTLMVHCDMGISRSSAVAAVISRLKLGEEAEFFEEPFDPNPRVYAILREIASGRADYADDFE